MGIDTTPGVYPGITPTKAGVPKHRKYLTMSQYICDDYMVTHNHSLANLRRGVGERVLFVDKALNPPQACTTGIFKQRCESTMRSVAARLGRQSPVTRQSFVEYYKGRRRTLYQAAADGLVLKPIRPQDSHLSTFIKAEKTNYSAKPDPAPRVIQPRRPRYNVELGKYLLPIEHKVYDAIDELFQSPTIMSKYNSFEQGKVLDDAWKSFRDPVCIGLDASRFDQHVSVEALKFEHEFYRTLFGHDDKFLKQILKWQLHNFGAAYAPDGFFKYNKKGSRMSGDMNTSLGNKLLMCLMAYAYIKTKTCRIVFVNNGDDCLMFLEKKDESKINDLQSYFKDFGFKIVLEPPVYELEHIEFCQCKPLRCNGIVRMVRNVKTCLVKDVTAVQLGHDVTQYRAWLANIAACGSSFACDVPVMGAFYRMLGRFGKTGKYNGHDAMFDCYRRLSKNAGCGASEPDDVGRYSFWKQTGINPDGQIAVEEYFDAAVWGDDKRQFIENVHIIIKNGN